MGLVRRGFARRLRTRHDALAGNTTTDGLESRGGDAATGTGRDGAGAIGALGTDPGVGWRLGDRIVALGWMVGHSLSRRRRCAAACSLQTALKPCTCAFLAIPLSFKSV